MRSFIIAEAGVNHNGSIDIAKRMIDVAFEAGVDAVKFQTFKAEKIVTVKASKAQYQIKNTKTEESQLEMLKKLELSWSAHRQLFAYCKKKKILFISTPFDEESADFLDGSGMSIFKIPSGEITNKPLIQHIAKKGKAIILSTGMSYLGEIEKAVNWIQEVKKKIMGPPIIQPLTLLHCVSRYPAAAEDINLLAMKTMEKAFKLPVGYSDHTLGIEIPIAAVALGATVIEKHVTLGKNMEGPDHKASIEPDELKRMVKAIRNVEKAMGNGIKKPTKNEKEMRGLVRRSLVARKNIQRGNMIKGVDILIKRPGYGISPEFKNFIVGMQAKRDIQGDSIIHWEDLKDA